MVFIRFMSKSIQNTGQVKCNKLIDLVIKYQIILSIVVLNALFFDYLVTIHSASQGYAARCSACFVTQPHLVEKTVSHSST
jgi:hypothetical protein